MSTIDHPHIMKLFEYMETINNYYMIIQYCNGGDLDQFIKSIGYLKESDAKIFFSQLMQGFKILH